MSTTTLLVRKNQLAETRLHTAEASSLTDGQVRVRVDSFALTSNNIKKRSADWGPAGLGQRLVQAWQAFILRVTQDPSPWLQTRQHTGGEAVSAVYQEVLAGKGDPRTGHILSL